MGGKLRNGLKPTRFDRVAHVRHASHIAEFQWNLFIELYRQVSLLLLGKRKSADFFQPGTGVSVFIANFGDFRNYTSQCFVDGHSLPTVIDQDDPNQSGSNIRLCAGFSLPDQQHSLFVSVSVPVDQNPAQHGWSTGFFLDYIVAEPSSSSNLDRMNKILAFVGNPFGGSPPAAPVVDTSSGMPWWFTAGRGVFQYTFSLPFTGLIDPLKSFVDILF